MTGRISEEDIGKLFVFSKYPVPGCFMSYARVLAESSPHSRLSFVGLVGTDPDHKGEAIPGKWTYGDVFRADSTEEVLMKAYAMGLIPVEIDMESLELRQDFGFRP